MRLHSSAPTRIDLAGGTLDIWPLYLYHEHAQTLNVAIDRRARCTLSPRDRGVSIRSEDTGQQITVDHWSDLRDGSELRLIGRLLHHFQATGVALVTRSDSPLGAGIAGSSALNVAICGALARWSGEQRARAPSSPPGWAGTPYTADELLQIAMNVEAQAIDVPTGVQDYRPAFYGGISAVELGVAGVRRVALDVDPRELERRLVLAYTGASRNSGINNWDVTKRHIDGDRQVFDTFERIRDIASAMRAALERHDWTEVGRQIGAEWENRKHLAPGVTTPLIDALLEGARAAGAVSGKICGAGGGGCLICFAEPDRVAAVRRALEAGGARLLDFHIDLEGLRVEEDPSSIDH